MTDHAEEFEEHRQVLIGLAYRLLGSVWDAEDVVQDAYLRWSRVDRAEVRDARGFLITVVSRLAIDQLRSARVTREAYVGPWLPEPVATDTLGPLDTAELRDTVAYATVHLMERLSPPERAVFVLREAFQLPYEEIADVVDASVANCRQMYSRAGRHLAAGRDRFPLSDDEHAKLLGRFLEAAAGGDQSALAEQHAEDV
ncbi:sigma-70 family RNA polymerase sigma factor, partial [Streptomyces violascens]|uniref:sigma-70 family RNA polymerase sigma factor n=1 Tax=Streptomyces violascens TaxID=67381 RepID=UPI0036AE529C